MANPERWKRFEELPDDLRDRIGRLPELLARRSVLLAYVFGSLAESETPPEDVNWPCSSRASRPTRSEPTSKRRSEPAEST